MVKLNTPPARQPRSADDVMQEVSKRLPQLVDHMFMDRDWIWYCGPALTGKENAATRKILGKDGIGFRFSMGGHVMPDGKTIGYWGHSCAKPMMPRRRPVAPTAQVKHPRIEDTEDAAKLFRSLGL